jgi:molybdenum-dependent DNA-binding transcriptional regulator ModE
MRLPFEKAHKLIDQLEKTLSETSVHTQTARSLISEWMTKGEAKLRARSASALKEVRKRADRFTNALTDLEKSFAKSLDRLSDQVAGTSPETKDSTPTKKQPKKKTSAPEAKPVKAEKGAKKARQTAEPTAVKEPKAKATAKKNSDKKASTKKASSPQKTATKTPSTKKTAAKKATTK